MNWNMMSEDERVHLWRSLRKDIETLERNDKISKVVEFVSTISYTSRTIDYYTPGSWPLPWEILYNRLFCVNGIAILMYHTLRLVGIDQIDMLLVNYADDVFLLPCIDGIDVLNFSIGEICNLDDLEKNDKFRIINVFDETSIKQVV